MSKSFISSIELKKNKHLGLRFISIRIQFAKYFFDDIFIHFCPSSNFNVIIINALQTNPFFSFLISYLRIIGLIITSIIFIKIDKMLIHSSRASNQVNFLFLLYYLKNFCQTLSIMMIHIINLIDGYEFTILEFHVATVKTVQEGLCLTDDYVAWGMT